MPNPAHHPVTQGAAETEVRRRPVPQLTVLRLLRPGETEIRAASTALGIELPVAANVLRGTPNVARLGPGEWIIFDGPPRAELAAKLGAILHALNTPTPGKAAWTISGPRAADLLNAGCTLDLHPTVFKPASIARTLLAGVSVLIARPGAAPSFDLIADRALAHHVESWFVAAAIT